MSPRNPFRAPFGVFSPRFLWKHLRYAILLVAVAAAIAIPSPDAKTMFRFMAPMLALYFLGIIVKALRGRDTSK